MSIIVNIGMWFERFVIVVTSLHRDFLPSSWDLYIPTWVDWCIMAGSFRYVFYLLPALCSHSSLIAIAEVKADEGNDAVKKAMGHHKE